jgi:hypothetical protein
MATARVMAKLRLEPTMARAVISTFIAKVTATTTASGRAELRIEICLEL